jgi:hypothetical protein
MLIGYMRVSKSDGSQTVDVQRDALIAAGVDPKQIYEDRASGRLDARPGLEATLKALRPGDTLMVWKLDRLGRNLRHLVNTVHPSDRRGESKAPREHVRLCRDIYGRRRKGSPSCGCFMERILDRHGPSEILQIGW